MIILTDGVIHDMEKTKKLIVDASNLPCSVIIIGVGGADFSMMEQLDGDEQRLKSGNVFAVRDIVQFVRYLECSQAGNLAEQVLKELPD